MTDWEALAFLVSACVGATAVVEVVGRYVMRATGDSPVRRVHGRYVYWWMVAGTAASVPLLPVAAPSVGAACGWPLFCMLCGWLVGRVHGGLVLLWRRLRGRTPDGRRSI